MDFTTFGSCLIKKIKAIFVNFSTLMSAIYRIFIDVLDDNMTSVVTKTVTVGFFLSSLFYSKNSDNHSIP